MNSIMKAEKSPVLSRSRVAAIQPTPTNDKALNTCHRRYDSRILFANSRTLVIHHEGSDYLLRITNQGKLILTK